MAAKKTNRKAAEEITLPKRLAGVKIPKELRRQAHHLAELAQHPLVKEIVAAGLIALAATVRQKKGGAVDKVKRKVSDAAEAAAGAATEVLETAPAAAKKPVRKAAAKPAAAKASKPAAAKVAKPAGKLPPPPPRTPRARRPATPKTTH